MNQQVMGVLGSLLTLLSLWILVSVFFRRLRSMAVCKSIRRDPDKVVLNTGTLSSPKLRCRKGTFGIVAPKGKVRVEIFSTRRFSVNGLPVFRTIHQGSGPRYPVTTRKGKSRRKDDTLRYFHQAYCNGTPTAFDLSGRGTINILIIAEEDSRLNYTLTQR